MRQPRTCLGAALLLSLGVSVGGCGGTAETDAGATRADASAVDVGERDSSVGDAGPTPAAVGEPCPPMSIPPGGGYDAREVHLESTAACETPSGATGSCLVYHLEGDPSPGCVGPSCADPTDVAERVTCTCRCSGGDGVDLCTCPGGTTCVDDIVTAGSPSINGGYCVLSSAL